MVGFTYRVINSPKYGRLQYQATYNYMQRNLWSGTTFLPLVRDWPNWSARDRPDGVCQHALLHSVDRLTELPPRPILATESCRGGGVFVSARQLLSRGEGRRR